MAKNRDFLDHILESVPEKGSFEPGAVYIEEGDKLIVMIEDVDYNAERIDSILTVYKADKGGRGIGIKELETELKIHKGKET